MHSISNINALDNEPWDCVVIGAGLAGCTAALKLSQENRRILLVERARFPRDKVCGGCLNQRALDILDRLDARESVLHAGAVTQYALELAAKGRKLRLSMPPGLAISRATLDTLMSEAVSAAGGTFVQGTKAELGGTTSEHRLVSLSSEQGQVTVRARMVLAADGLHGGTLRSTGHEPSIARGARVGAGTLLPPGSIAVERGVIQMAVADGGYVGAALVEDGRIDVAAAFDQAYLRQCGGPAGAANDVLEKAGCAPIPATVSAKWKGTPPLTRRNPVLGGERVLVLGDAAGYIEPFTGEGMAWALTSGYAVVPLVARALDDDAPFLLEEWQQTYRKYVGSRQLVCRGVATLLRYPVAVQTLLQVLRWQPALVTPLMRYVNAPAF